MPTPDSSIITQLVRSRALANNQIGLQQNGRKPNNTFGAQQYNSSRPSTKKMQPLPFDQQIRLLFNQLNNPLQITQEFFTNLNDRLKNQTQPSLIPITSTALRTYYNNNKLPPTINFLGTIKDSDGNQSFPLSNLTSGEYFAFSNNYPTYITSDSITYRITVISSGANAGKLIIESKDLINTSYTSINNSPFDKGDNFTLGNNIYYYAGAGSPGIIFSTVPFPNITVNVSDFLGTDNTVDATNVTGDSVSGTISNTLGSEKLCFPWNLSLGVTPNTFILHDKKRIAKISITIDDRQQEVPRITTLYTFPDASTANYANFSCACIQKDDNTFFWTKGASNLIYYTDDNFATEKFIGDPNYQQLVSGYVPPTDNPPQFDTLTKLIFNNTKTKIYVPDLYVSLLRIVDISNMTNITVQTVKDFNGNDVNFSKVIDVKEYDEQHLLLSIQTSKGGNQLIIFDINSGIISRTYGNGEQTWVDSDKDNSSITGNSGIEIDYANERVYFTHDGSGIRMLDLNTENFCTIAGSTLGYVNNGQLSKFNKVMGILYDNTTQSLYVCDGANYRIRKVKLALQNPNPIVNCNYASGFDHPFGITIDSAGNLYVCNHQGNGTISKVDTNRNVTTYVSGINSPTGITIDSSGNLYVCNFNGDTVSKIDTSGNKTTYASGFNGPHGITIDSSGNLYVTNLSNNTVSKVDTSGNKTTYASGFNGPHGITIDSSGNLYVSNFNDTVSKIDTSGNVTTYASGFDHPFGITIDSSGNLYVCNFYGNTVSKVDTSGNVTTYASGFNRPVGITIDSSGNLYVCNYNNNTICKITPPNSGGSTVVIITPPNIGTYNIQFRVIGVTPGNITQDMKNNFKNDFAALIGVDPAMLTIELQSGSLFVNISFDASYGASGFSDNDSALIKNTIAILNQVSISDIEKIKNDRNIAFTWSISAYIDYENIKINIDIGLINTINSRFNNYNISNPLVGDIKNNCMYTIIGSIVVRINRNGTISRIALFPESNGCRYIFIDSTSSFLVIPSNVRDTTITGASDNSPKSNKVYIIRLSDGTVFTKTLNELYQTESNCGFNQFNNRFYYTSYMAGINKYLNLCYIPITLSNETLTATYTTINGGNNGKIEFIDNNTGFISNSNNIQLLNFSNNTSSIIAGNQKIGIWNNVTLIPGYPETNIWHGSNGGVYGPYLDAPIGSNAFFSHIEDITYDSENNRLLVADMYAQRIRSVDLRAGNNYRVTTLAGTSPVLGGQAANGPNSNYTLQVLASLGQVGYWNNGTNQMPSYTKVNSSYLNSTFDSPRRLIAFKGKIYVLDNTGVTRQLVNNRVSDFQPFANDITKITLGSLGGGPSITFTISNSNFTLSNTEKQSFINEFMKSYPSINKDNLVFTFTSGSIVVNIKYKDNLDITTLTNDELSSIQNLEVAFSDKVEVLANFRTAITTTTFSAGGSITLDLGQTSTITGEIIITIPINLIDYIDGKLPNKISPLFLQFGNDGTIYTTNGLNDVLSVDRRFGFTTKICTLPPPTIPNTTRTVSGVIAIDSLNRYLIVQDSLSDNTNTYVSPSYFYIVDISTKTSYQINASDFATGISGYNSSVNISSIVFNKFNNKIYIDIRFLQNNAYPPIGYFSGTFNYSSKTFSLDSNTPLTNFDYNLASNYNSIANPTGTNSSGSSSTSFIFINANEYICTINNQICRFNINTNLLTRIIGDLNISLRKFNPNTNVEQVLWGKFNYNISLGPILFSQVAGFVYYNSISDTLFVCDRTAKVMLSISPILGAGTPTITKIYGTPNVDLDAQGYPNSSLITNPLEPRRFFINNVTGTNKGTLTPNTLNFIYPLLVLQNVLDNKIYVTGFSSKLIRNPSSITQDSEIYETTVIVGNKAIIYKINNTS